ncbi:MAG: MOSC domain-containing protein [Pseudonocardiaceae bacterium]
METPEPMVGLAHGTITAVWASPTHTMAKAQQPVLRLITGFGIEGDVHSGDDEDNLRQVHLLGVECHAALRIVGYHLQPGQMGENVTTSGIALTALPAGAWLHLGESAVVEVTGQRFPCRQLEGVAPGLLAAVLDRDDRGNLVRNVGIMAKVVANGSIRPDDPVKVELPPIPHQPLLFL